MRFYFFLLFSLNLVLINDKMYPLSEKHILHMISTIYNLNESIALASLVPFLKHRTPESKNMSLKFFSTNYCTFLLILIYPWAHIAADFMIHQPKD